MTQSGVTKVLRRLLQEVADGSITPDTALDRIVNKDSNLQFARVDLDRSGRTGFPEAIYCPGKTPDQIARIAETLASAGQTVLATRADEAAFDAIKALLPDAEFNELAKSVVVRAADTRKLPGRVLVLTGGTSDLPVAEEAAVTAQTYGAEVKRLWDVGVAGVHRLLAQQNEIDEATVLIAVAGMEGALPSVVSGLANVPVIAVPTSVGYGASFNGLAALLAMLNSCAPGVSVVNIDNGFGAGFMAAQICRIASQAK